MTSGTATAMSGARLHDHHDDRRPADPGAEVDVPDIEVPKETSEDEPPVEKAPEEQEDA